MKVQEPLVSVDFKSPQRLRENVFKFLKLIGEWVISKEIETEFDIADSVVRDCVRDLRKEHKPVASGSKGYKYSLDPEDYDEFIATQNSKIKNMIRTVENIKVIQRRLNQSDDKLYDNHLEGDDRIIVVGGKQVCEREIHNVFKLKEEDDMFDIFMDVYSNTEVAEELIRMGKYGYKLK